jgi:NADH-quinone oxidoreductase subunit N
MEFGIHDFLGVAPLALGVLAGMGVITLDIFLSRGDDREIMPVTTAGAIVGMAVLLGCLWGEKHELFGGHLIVDAFGLVTALVCCFTSLVVVLMSPRYIERRGMEYGEYYGLILLALVGMILMCMGGNLIVLFLALETMSLAIYGLVGMCKTDPRGAEAATKYFVMGAFGSGFLAFGIALLYMGAGTLDLSVMPERIALLINDGARSVLLPGAAMVLTGLLFKLGAVPFHSWVPDVYQGSPSPVMAFMASSVKVAAGVAMARIVFEALGEFQISQMIKDVIVVVAWASMLYGSVVALVQHNIQRLLGYSAIAHTGFLLMAFLGKGYLQTGTASLQVYLASYAISVVGILGVMAQLQRGRHDVTDLEHIQGLARHRPGLAAAMWLFLLSLAGLPGTVGFIGKLAVFSEAIAGGYIGTTVVAVIVSLVAFGYYLPVIISMYMKEPVQEFTDDGRGWSANAATWLAALATLGLGLFPETLIQLGRTAAAQFYG